jgi:hypothetical protein
VSAALEFAVTQLKVGGRGAGPWRVRRRRAALDQPSPAQPPGAAASSPLGGSLLDEARDRIVAELGTGPDAVRALELECVKVSIANLRTFPCIPSARRRASFGCAAPISRSPTAFSTCSTRTAAPFRQPDLRRIAGTPPSAQRWAAIR